jgi:L-alanine-DL-glutamate epimerase-like enolase superfamily enzyme
MGMGNWELGIGKRTRAIFLPCLSYSLLPTSHSPITYSYLLPTGKKALESWQAPWNQGYRTFKWKIGVASIEDELNVFDQLIQALPSSTQLRWMRMED